MTYLEKRTIAGKHYYYAKESYREKGKVKTRTVAYLGTDRKKAEEQLKTKKITIFTESEQERSDSIKQAFTTFVKTLDHDSHEQIMRDFVIVFTNETNRIEGSTFTVKETRMLLEDGIVPDGKNLREVYEQTNTKALFDAHTKKPFTITEKDLIAIHDLFVQNIDERKGYRTRPNRILGSSTKTSPPEHIATDMRILITWYKKNVKLLPPLALAALFHAKFEQIHPFADCNGRTGRFITYVMLKKSLPILFPDRKRYLDALEASQNKSLSSTERKDYETILAYFLHAQEHTWKNFFAIR